MNNGEANIEMREAQLKSPTNIRRIALSSICKPPTSMITNMPKTAKSNPSILTYQMTVYSTQQLKKINQFFVAFIIHKTPIVHQKINLSCFLSINQEEGYVHKLKDSPNCINSSHQQIIRRYKRCAIPQAYQAVQERINIWQP